MQQSPHPIIVAKDAAHILVVDDDTRIRTLLSKYLEEQGYIVVGAKDAQEAETLLLHLEVDLLVLDLMLPGEGGLSFATRFRRQSTLPILMLTAMGETADRIAGLESGADDYLAKPFEPKELLLRIERILARTRTLKTAEHEVRIGNLLFDIETQRLTESNGTQIQLSTGEAKLLATLAGSVGRVMLRHELAALCGGIHERSVDVQVIRLRQKIEADPKKPVYLQTIRGEGYVLYL